MRLHRVWIVEQSGECYTEHGSSVAARAAFDSIELGPNEYKYLFIAHDDEDGNFYPEFDVALDYEGR